MGVAAASASFDCTDERATERLGAAIAHAVQTLKAGPVLMTLSGELGAGKTTLVRAILRGLGHRGPVPSPTYMLLEPYEAGGWGIAHVDCYRLQRPSELENLGLRDWLSGRRLTLLEWPENAAEALPVPDIRIVIRATQARRTFEFKAETERGEAILAQLGAPAATKS